MEQRPQEQHRRKQLHCTLPGKPSQDHFIAFTLFIMWPLWTRKFSSSGPVCVLLTCAIAVLVFENIFKIYLKLLMHLILISGRTILSSSSKSRAAIWVGLAGLKWRENSYSIASLSNYQLSKSSLTNCRMLYSAPEWAALRQGHLNFRKHFWRTGFCIFNFTVEDTYFFSFKECNTF